LEEIAAGAEKAAAAEAAAAEGGGDDGDADAGDGKVVNGVSVPAHLLDRSKHARERLGA
jgi:hypothetical protein